jgi:micrococcal nuclease
MQPSTHTAFVLIAATASPCFAADPAILEGIVSHVRDGDAIEVGKIPVRLNRVSAPELDEPLGHKSKAFMVKLVDGKRVRCELNEEKTYDRFVGVCFLDGEDINGSIIQAGLALDCPKYSNGRYKVAEVAAA